MRNNLLKRAACALLALAIMITIPLSVFAEGFNQDVKKGTVLVLTEIETTDGTIYGWGTGFFVGAQGKDPEYLITNYHVVEDFLTLGGGQGVASLSVVYDGKMVYKKIVGMEEHNGESYLTVTSMDVTLSKNDYEEAYYVSGDEVKDIALLKLAKPTNKRSALSLMVPDEALVGSQVYAVGFPGSTEYTVNAVASFGVDGASVTSGVISRFTTESGTGRSLIQTNANISGGNSGGPLVDTNGAVLGLNTLGSQLDTNLFYAVSINEVIPMLRNNNISFDFYAPTKPDYMLFIYIGGAVVGAVVLVTLIILLTRKKTVPAMQAVPAGNAASFGSSTPAISQSNTQPILRSMSAQHGGMTVPLSQQPIVIGRDVASCRIVFKEGTPGISSRHCQIYYDDVNGVFVLTDLKSTYGTFLSGGQKLTPNVPYTLRQRDSFYLGEQDNALYVDLS